MGEWWNGLELLTRIYAVAAITSTAILVIQTIMVLLGGGEGFDGVDFDADVDVDIDFDSMTDGLELFSVRGIMAFFAVGGWLGIALLESGVSTALVILFSFLAGFAALFGLMFLFRALRRLQSDGTLQMKNAIGKTGTVYITIPANQSRSGKIMISFQGKLNECEAVTAEQRDLKTGESVKVVELVGAEILLVVPASS